MDLKSQNKEQDNVTKDDTEALLDLQKDREEEFILDALEGIPEEKICFHTPDQLEHIDSYSEGDNYIHVFKCSCGKEVREEFRYSDRTIL